MPDQFSLSRRLSGKVRFSGDDLDGDSSLYSPDSERLKSHFFYNDLAITEEVTPGLHRALSSVLARLSIPGGLVDAFVYPSNDFNAQCYSIDNENCILRFSSSLIDILTEEEFQFVVGHEIGHFLYLHSFARLGIGQDSPEFFLKQRNQEISADRIGLIGCSSVNASIMALLKTVSGLNSRHLKFDVGAFLSQLKRIDLESIRCFSSTHPSILVRCRSLLWFSTLGIEDLHLLEYNKCDVEKVDSYVQKDIDAYVDSFLNEKVVQAKQDVRMWSAVFEIVSSGSFNKSDQKEFAEVFGEDLLDKVVHFLRDYSSSQLEEVSFNKLREARSELENIIPISFESEMESLQHWRN